MPVLKLVLNENSYQFNLPILYAIPADFILQSEFKLIRNLALKVQTLEYSQAR